MLRRSSRYTHTATNRKTSLTRRLRVEPLENRRMLVAYTVDSLGDVDDGDPNNGSTTLREAVNLANANPGLDYIKFGLPAGSTITLSGTELELTDSVNINGPGSGQLTIDAQGNSRVFHFNQAGTAALSGLTITGGDASGEAENSGGGIRNFNSDLSISDAVIDNNSSNFGGGVIHFGTTTAATLIINNSTISNNTSTFRGGGLYNVSNNQQATVEINNSKITDNNASEHGGGIINISFNNGDSIMTITDSTIDSNHAGGSGGGIYNLKDDNGNAAILNIIDSAISNNTVSFAGGGIFNFQGNANLENSTISDNESVTASGGLSNFNGTIDVKYSTITNNSAFDEGNSLGGGGIGNFGNGSVSIEASIIAGNNSDTANDIQNSLGTFTSSGNNITGATAGVITFLPSDMQNTDPLLGPLQDNGGLTWTHALMPGSPAIDAIDPALITPAATDQRGLSRPQDGDGDNIAWIDIGSYEKKIPLIVNDTGDADDGDQLNGQMTLREAINLANQYDEEDFITFDFSALGPGPHTIELTNELAITQSLTIDGLGADQLIIDAGGVGDPETGGDGIRIFNINNHDNSPDIDVSLSGLTLTGGDVHGDGGAIYNKENLTITDSTISDNTAEDSGGGLYNSSTGNMTITDSTISNNTAEDRGGGLNNSSSGNMTITDSTISNNTALGDGGGGVYSSFSGTLTITDSTISDNTARTGGGVDSRFDSYTTIINSTISGNTATTIGGGVRNEDSRLTISGSTISDNMASFGGGVNSRINASADDYTTIINSTISGNTATNIGGGVRNRSGVTEIQNSTITNNTAPDGQGSGIVSGGNTIARTEISDSIVAGNTNSDMNLFNGGTNFFFSLGNNILGNDPTSFAIATDMVGVDPQLGPLQDNGGPTETHALSLGSPAVDAIPLGTPDQPTTDQRGTERPQRGGFDIGAVEVGYLLGDLNQDDVVDSADLAILLENYGKATAAQPLEGDLDDDQLIGLKDLLLMKQNFGNTLSAPVPAPQAAAVLQVNIDPENIQKSKLTSSTETIVSSNAIIQQARKRSQQPIVEYRAAHNRPTATDQAIESFNQEDRSFSRESLSQLRAKRRLKLTPIDLLPLQ